jgi:enamine deaminase RidA (YjgF/YER057c/UK114 family)
LFSEKIRQPSGHFSQATMIEARGRLVFISGMTARCADGSIAGIGDIEAQTRQVCENIKSAVEEAGGTMDDICRVDVYVRNMEHFRLHSQSATRIFQAARTRLDHGRGLQNDVAGLSDRDERDCGPR